MSRNAPLADALSGREKIVVLAPIRTMKHLAAAAFWPVPLQAPGRMLSA